MTTKWIAQRRDGKSNGQPFPYEHFEYTYTYLMGVYDAEGRQIAMSTTNEQNRALDFGDYHKAKRMAKIFGGTAVKVRIEQSHAI